MEHFHERKPGTTEEHAPRERKTETRSMDPVCGMMIGAESAAGSVEHAGRKYHFCSEACREKFRAYPERYAT